MNLADLNDTDRRVYHDRIEHQLQIELEKMDHLCPNLAQNWDSSDRWICYKMLEQFDLTTNSKEKEFVKQLQDYSRILNSTDGSMPNVLWDDVRIEQVDTAELTTFGFNTQPHSFRIRYWPFQPFIPFTSRYDLSLYLMWTPCAFLLTIMILIWSRLTCRKMHQSWSCLFEPVYGPACKHGLTRYRIHKVV